MADCCNLRYYCNFVRKTCDLAMNLVKICSSARFDFYKCIIRNWHINFETFWKEDKNRLNCSFLFAENCCELIKPYKTINHSCNSEHHTMTPYLFVRTQKLTVTINYCYPHKSCLCNQIIPTCHVVVGGLT